MSNVEKENKINSLNCELNMLCLTLGERYYTLKKDCPDEELASIVGDISNKKAEIDRLKDEEHEACLNQTEENKAGENTSEETIQEVSEAVAPVEIVEPVVIPVPEVIEEKKETVAHVLKNRFCVGCGAKLDAEDLFCTQCGMKQPIEDNQVEVVKAVTPVPEIVPVMENASSVEEETDADATILVKDVAEDTPDTEEKMVFCGFCRAKISKDDMYCVECGAKQF